MGAYACVGGKVQKNGVEVPEVTKWGIKPTSNNNRYASSSTGGWRKSLPGIKELTITIEAKADDTTEIEDLWLPGEEIASLELFKKTGTSYAGPARVDDIDIQIDIETQAIVGYVVTLSSNGAWPDFED